MNERPNHRILLKGGPRDNAEFLVAGDQVPAIERYGWDVAVPVDIVGLADPAPTLGQRTRAHYHYHATVPPTDLTPQPTLILAYDTPVIRPEVNPESQLTTYRNPAMIGLPSLPGSAPTPGLPVVDVQATEAARSGYQYRPGVVVLPSPTATWGTPTHAVAGYGQVGTVIPLPTPDIPLDTPDIRNPE